MQHCEMKLLFTSLARAPSYSCFELAVTGVVNIAFPAGGRAVSTILFTSPPENFCSLLGVDLVEERQTGTCLEIGKRKLNAS
jgi:hypothetical protein